jgi:hypothetical protein
MCLFIWIKGPKVLETEGKVLKDSMSFITTQFPPDEYHIEREADPIGVLWV